MIEVPAEVTHYGSLSTRQWVVILLIAELISVLVPTGLLSVFFRFPDILRQPASVALPLFTASQSIIVPAYYLFMLSGMLYLPLSVLLRRLMGTRAGADLLVGLGLGRGNCSVRQTVYLLTDVNRKKAYVQKLLSPASKCQTECP